MRPLSLVLTVAIAATASSCIPTLQATAPQIRALPTLKDVMHASATTADPQFKKIGAASYGDEDWAAFTETASRLDAVGESAKKFTKGPEFDALADTLRAHAAELGRAAEAKDAGAASKALTELKQTCKSCHGKFR